MDQEPKQVSAAGLDPISEFLEQYSSGNRDPRTLGALNRISWEHFHSPWEAWPPNPETSVAKRKDTLSIPPSQVVRPVSPLRLTRCLDRLDVCYQRESNHLITATWEPDPGTEDLVKMTLSLEGDGHTVLVLTSRIDRDIPEDRLEKALEVCNKWNCERRWPRAFMHPMAGQGPGLCRVALDVHLHLSNGIHDEFLESLIRDFISGSAECWGQTMAHTGMEEYLETDAPEDP